MAKYSFLETDDALEAADRYRKLVEPYNIRMRQAEAMDPGMRRDQAADKIRAELKPIDTAYLAHKEKLDAKFLEGWPQYTEKMQAEEVKADAEVEKALVSVREAIHRRAELALRRQEAFRMFERVSVDAGNREDIGISGRLGVTCKGQRLQRSGDDYPSQVQNFARQIQQIFLTGE